MKKIALVVGHTESSQGASNADGTTEFQFNDEQCRVTAEKLVEAGFEAVVMYRENGYSQLPHDVNRTGCDLAIEFHCNAANKKISGSEVVHFPNSKNGIRFAELLQDETIKVLGLRNRGIRTPWNGRGDVLLKGTRMPCVIWEPFFIDNDCDLSMATDYRDELCGALVTAVQRYFDA